MGGGALRGKMAALHKLLYNVPLHGGGLMGAELLTGGSSLPASSTPLKRKKHTHTHPHTHTHKIRGRRENELEKEERRQDETGRGRQKDARG